MADDIRATPRSPLFGLFSDIVNVPLDYMSDPRRTQQMQGVASFIRGTGVPSTLQNLAYDPSGRGLFTGAGGLGGTTRMRPEVIEAAMTVAPMVGPAARLAGRGAMAAGRAGEQFAERSLPGVMERGGLPAEMAMGMSNRTISPLDVYHGTPHQFPPTARNPLGEFDSSKIGTGEGAQVYGHGLYLAEAPAVAKGYQDRLGVNLITVDGKPMDFNNPVHIAASIISDPNNAGLPGKQLASAIRYDPTGIVPVGAKSKVEEIAKALESENLPKFSNQKGNLYKVDLPDEQIGKMLDFDKPLSQQSDYIKNIIKEYELDYVPPDATGGRLIEELNKAFDPATVSMHLKNAGITGIKYLDEKSRSNFMIQNTYKGQPYGDPVSFMTEQQAKDYATKQVQKGFGVQEISGTRNFVIFPGEEKSMTIFERNGQIASPLYTDPFANTIGDTTR